MPYLNTEETIIEIQYPPEMGGSESQKPNKQNLTINIFIPSLP
jgi:hypothetical protein